MPKRHMLVFDTAYTYRMLIERNLAAIVTGKDHDGYFDHVWTVHPVAGLLGENDDERYGKPSVRELAPRHTHIEGKIGRYRWLRRFEKINFALALVSLMWLVFRLVRKNKIGIIRSEEIFCGPLAVAIGWWFKLPVMQGVWGNPGHIREQAGGPIVPRLFGSVKREEAVERWVLHHVDMVLSQNEDNRRYIIDQGVPIERTAIWRFGNLIDGRHFIDPRERPDGSADLAAIGVADKNTLLCISRLEELKRPDHAILALKALLDAGGDAVLLMAGDGRYKSHLEELAMRIGVADRTIFLGNRDQLWLWRVIPKVSVILAPLAGRGLAESALGGTPIVAYDVDWHSEVVETGKTGELVRHLDAEGMGKGAHRLLTDPEYARRAGVAIRERVLELLDRDKADSDQIAVYEKLLNRDRQGSPGRVPPS